MAKRIGDAAKTAGVGVETVRFYEREGLIDRPQKPVRGWREYDARTLAQLDQVRLAKTFGLTLRDMKQIRDRARGGRAGFCATVRDTVSARLEAIESEIAELERKRAALKQWQGVCRARGGQAACPLYARLESLAPAPTRSGRRG